MKNKPLIITVISLALLGTGGYFFYRWWKTKKFADIKKYLINKEEINKFREWFIKNYPNANILIQLEKSGGLNLKVLEAWNTKDGKGFKVGEFYSQYFNQPKAGEEYYIKEGIKSNEWQTDNATSLSDMKLLNRNVTVPSGNENVYTILKEFIENVNPPQSISNIINKKTNRAYQVYSKNLIKK